jgi:tetraprenyl-beta-curcumene synthase
MMDSIRLWSIVFGIYRDVLPMVRLYLEQWKEQAQHIPDPELRQQALQSIETKTFHCEGGSIYGLLAKNHLPQVIRFIVAYQTLSDYLDNLCDRSNSLNPDDFSALHEASLHALTPGITSTHYYRFRHQQDDGNYLRNLVKTCQDVLQELPGYPKVAAALHELANYYCQLQVHKHVRVEERVPRLQAWFEQYRERMPDISWYEFSASTGSTLGIFCLVAYACDDTCSAQLVQRVKGSYFPWVQGLHILLDYLIDQEEDRREGDLNFCTYYSNPQTLSQRMTHFFQQADISVARLPHAQFHRLINRGLLGIYLADEKVNQQESVRQVAQRLLRTGGGSALVFFVNGLLMARLRLLFQ